ncbi:Mobile element protein [Fimbriiglobus ruber]|uniref:Mobile element protein n=1 Tax=Fimbriiglobus ruber TaxID=1908690 RepID=A0A225CXY4_9BACT|nr:Mobile element protein [Fimbriiglobus ruber]OWK43383.1 Mobile element protein [Fimbriiglobus ruber]
MTADRESILPTIWEVSDDLWARIEPILAAAWPRRDPVVGITRIGVGA